jgi:phosphoinositide-3-kinase, regulatory subunit 4
MILYSIDKDAIVPTWVETWNTSVANQSNRAQQRISLINNSQQKLLRAHHDVVTALATIDSPFRGGVVSGDRSGTIKVWRVDVVGEQ